MQTTHRSHRKIHTLVIACAFDIAALAVFANAAFAEDARTSTAVILARVESLPVPDLERAFWVCDHTAALHGVHAAPVEVCSAIYDALRQHKFGGDFNALLGWWQQNKHLEHDALANGR